MIDNNKSEPDQPSDLKKPTEYYNIDGKIFAIADSMNIKVQHTNCNLYIDYEVFK